MLTKKDICKYNECLDILKALKMRGHACHIGMDNWFFVVSGNETQTYSICVYGRVESALKDDMVVRAYNITIQDALKMLTEFLATTTA